MAEDKANQKLKYRFSVESLAKYMAADLNDKQAEEYVLKALTYYKKHLDRKARKEIGKSLLNLNNSKNTIKTYTYYIVL